LAGDRLEGALTDLSDTDTGTDGSETCSDCTSCICHFGQQHYVH
jgi:hypothetical protein